MGPAYVVEVVAETVDVVVAVTVTGAGVKVEVTAACWVVVLLMVLQLAAVTVLHFARPVEDDWAIVTTATWPSMTSKAPLRGPILRECMACRCKTQAQTMWMRKSQDRAQLQE